jgi:hypothetical protein
MNLTEELQAEFIALNQGDYVARKSSEADTPILRDDAWVVDVSNPKRVQLHYFERGKFELREVFASELEATNWLRKKCDRPAPTATLTPEEERHGLIRAREIDAELDALLAAAEKSAEQ